MTTAIQTVGASVLGVLLLVPSASEAQETDAVPIPRVELSGGYMLMRDTESGETFPGGWYFSGAVHTTRWFGVVGEAAGGYTGNDLANGEWSAQSYTIVGGPRVIYPVGRIVPFAQFLAGLGHVERELSISSFGRSHISKSSHSHLALQPGAGITLYLSDRIGLRLSADYRMFLRQSSRTWYADYSFRTAAGLTFGWGVR